MSYSCCVLQLSKEPKMQGLPLLPNSSCCSTWGLPHPWHKLCSSWLHWNKQDLNQDIKMKVFNEQFGDNISFQHTQRHTFPCELCPSSDFQHFIHAPMNNSLCSCLFPKEILMIRLKILIFWLPAASRTPNIRGNGISKAGCSWEMQEAAWMLFSTKQKKYPSAPTAQPQEQM